MIMENTNDKTAVQIQCYSHYANGMKEDGRGPWVKYADHLAVSSARAEEARREAARAWAKCDELEALNTNLREQLAQRTAGGDAVALPPVVCVTRPTTTRDTCTVFFSRDVTDDELLEVNRALKSKLNNPDDAAQPVAEAAAQADDVLLPRVPTRAMLTAGFSKMCEVGKREIGQIYAAMAAAAPIAQPMAAQADDWQDEQPPTPQDEHMARIRGAIARAWCYPSNAHKVMDGNIVNAAALEVGRLFAAPTAQADGRRHRAIMHILRSLAGWQYNSSQNDLPYTEAAEAQVQFMLAAYGEAAGIAAAPTVQPTPAKTVEFDGIADGQELPAHEDFAAWLAREMPVGTVIGDPAWWAPRILRAALAMRQPQGETPAARDVLAERRRQVEAEGWTAEGDDKYSEGQMAVAAGYYALASGYPHERDIGKGKTPNYWPWNREWWKPRTARANLVRAGALVLAEIERIDRAAKQAGKEPS
jgi:hypothetical protein